MENQNLLQTWLQEEILARSFTGWDFSYLSNRMFEEQPPWDYMALAENLMRSAHALMDMGTGGGERLLELRPVWPEKVAVTEDYPPNLALARQRLEPYGVHIYPVDLTRTGMMPFEDGELRFKTSVDIEDSELTFKLIQNLVYMNFLMMDKYLPGIMSVIYAGTNPADAIAQVEE